MIQCLAFLDIKLDSPSGSFWMVVCCMTFYGHETAFKWTTLLLARKRKAALDSRGGQLKQAQDEGLNTQTTEQPRKRGGKNRGWKGVDNKYRKRKQRGKEDARKGHICIQVAFASLLDDDMTWLSYCRAIRQWFDLRAMI